MNFKGSQKTHNYTVTFLSSKAKVKKKKKETFPRVYFSTFSQKLRKRQRLWRSENFIFDFWPMEQEEKKKETLVVRYHFRFSDRYGL